MAHVYSSLECRRRFFSLRCVERWNALPDRVVAAESLDSFKGGLCASLNVELYSFVN